MHNLLCSFGSEIVIGEKIDLASLIKQALPNNSKRLAVITDANVAKLHGISLSEALEKNGLDHILIPSPAGEQYKTRKTKERVEDLLISSGFGRDCAIIGFGGGAVTDLAGFVAATFARGVPFFAIPTTLMGMVDAAIGGKVAVNTHLAKNIIGSFYPAKKILIDPHFLTTLPDIEILSGMAEVYKYGFIASPQLLEMITLNAPLSALIEICVGAKKEIVENDFAEQGLRRILNFGHTIAHALETASDYRLSHGLAVAAGMRAESWLSFALGYLSQSEFKKIVQMLNHFPPLPKLSNNKILNALIHDKKNSSIKPRFVMLEKIGSPLPFDQEFCRTVEPELIEEALKDIL